MTEQMGDSAWIGGSFAVSSALQWETPVAPIVPVAPISPAWREQLDARLDHITVLDKFGNLLWVNEAWREFGRLAGSNDPHSGVGTNYLDVCDRAHERGSFEAGIVAHGIRDVIAGIYNSVYFRYGFECPDRRHLFAVRITQHEQHGALRLLVSHERIL
ncbi:MAG: hypothetical protein JNM18_25420 [Planctomycetaceae bacterium]|nr:hypothetical protein [Planctomycetaceae bacterium]